MLLILTVKLIFGNSGSRFYAFGVPSWFFWGIGISWQPMRVGAMAIEGMIKGESLREMLGVGAQIDVTISAEQDAFVVLVGTGLTKCALQAKRGHIRRFKTLDSAAHYLNRIGCRYASVDLEHWTPAQRSIA